MSAAKHTPGPWVTDESDHDAPHQDVKIKATGGRTVCTIWIDDAPVPEFNAEQDCNARLITAAPDLLKAAQDARWRIANLSTAAVPFDDPRDGPVLRALDAAIAKATGSA